MSQSASNASVHVPTGVPTARLGIWLFLAGELLIFGGLVVTFILLRSRHPEWGAHAGHTLGAAGAFNTMVLLTSSLTVVLAHQAAGLGKIVKAQRLLAVTLALGLVFLCVKAYEYNHELHEGFTPVTNLFWSYYYLMTGLHGLHVVGGLVALGVVAVGARQHPHRIECAGMYWHLVDIVWIFLFPLLYLTS
jgi:heme/copper-type cytochrome/quinol oxidase subunit 3